MLRFMWRKREFYRVIWRCFARVKCGRVWKSGFGRCCDCRESHLSCDYRKWWQTNLRYVRLTSCYQNTFSVKHKNASWVFILGDFLLESLLCAQRLWILNLFSADTELWASRFDWLKDYNFSTFYMLFISSQNPITCARELYRLLPAIMLSLFSSLFTFS